MGIFAGQVPAGPFYTATKLDNVVELAPGVVPAANPTYSATTVGPVGDALGTAPPAAAWYTALASGPQPEAVAAYPITNKPPYSSAVQTFAGMEGNGQTPTLNPGRDGAIGALPPVTPDVVGLAPNGAYYTAQNPNS